jgi:hypothetical protein
MDFISFIILLVIAVVVSWVLHYPLKYYVTAGVWSFVSKVVIATSYRRFWVRLQS